ncbi:Proteinase inhibitor propeptide [Penicillium soppii]|uniref:Proteinase inhibitor propeptide n=1 Tax=Penicillium soppii TaxID=69789 RepID=UPI0025466AA8|nr:Proteinase inhibitor propeptide [Penicillium soppii]KAJ5865309.1 Proteinase inhibitor propeptide [Penicillium soppii]
MPSYIITLKQDTSADEVEAVKNEVKKQGGTIDHEYSLIKGFSVTFPESAVHTLENHEHVETIEADSEVRTQD